MLTISASNVIYVTNVYDIVYKILKLYIRYDMTVAMV